MRGCAQNLTETGLQPFRLGSKFDAMTIVRNLPEQLILVHAPWLMGGFLIVCIVGCSAAGLALAFSGETRGLLTLLFGSAIPLLLFGGLVKRHQVIFDGPRGQITLQRRSLWRYEARVFPLADLQRAELQEIADTARVVLLIQGTQPLPLIEAYLSGNGPSEAVKAISNWHAAWNATI